MVFEVAYHKFELIFHNPVFKRDSTLDINEPRYKEHLKNDCCSNEIMRFKFKFVISDLENH